MSAEESSLHPGSGQPLDVVECREALERLSEFLDSEVTDTDGDRIREHLADCEPCLSEYDIEDHIKKLVKRSCSESAPRELHARIRTQLTVLRGDLPG
ncbi:mycothiol system anti-sigma-R factor [Pengzhenrongella frigida]|uniref:Mycothiol system anti-sigma-R factor n=1 Tax=Pengzhenrongella frigida TaxID=1259133 RepID=A0A4Q5MX40_9MICO|nr:mycothiol system anti-sigma-R factor [Cellulomonas sp. HLT2-17]RYV50166.1 mycothiol system anti-sigma-R factor [Cellulomonas sp. HLT2-17]